MEECLAGPADLDHPIVLWMVRYVGEFIIGYRVRQGGRTVFRTMKGFDPVMPSTEFGECICIKFLQTPTGEPKFEDRRVEGLFLWIVFRRGEAIVAAKDGYVDSAGAI